MVRVTSALQMEASKPSQLKSVFRDWRKPEDSGKISRSKA